MNDLVRELIQNPLALELTLVGAFLVVGFMLYRRLGSLVRDVSRRRSLGEFVEGLDLYFKGDYDGAAERLEKVLEEDPEAIDARICLGDCRRAQGDAAEAHKHYFHVYKVYGRKIERNFVGLARALYEQGRYEEVEEPLRLALAMRPVDDEPFRLLVRSRLRRGDYAGAIEAQKRLLAFLPRQAPSMGQETEELGRLLAHAGIEALEWGRASEAVSLLEQSVRLAPSFIEPRVRLVEAVVRDRGPVEGRDVMAEQVRAMSELCSSPDFFFRPLAPFAPSGDASETAPPPEIALDRLLAPPLSSLDRLLPGGEALEVERVEEPPRAAGTREWIEVFRQGASSARNGGLRQAIGAILARDIPFACAGCGVYLPRWSESCPGCGAIDSITSRYDFYFRPLEGIQETLDEIEENRRYVRRLVAEVAQTGSPGAAAKLSEAGPPKIIDQVFLFLGKAEHPKALLDLLEGLGPDHIPACFDAWGRARALKRGGFLRRRSNPSRRHDRLMVELLARYGEAALPHLEALLRADEPEIRPILLDGFIVTGRGDVFDKLQYAYTPAEMIEALNGSPEESLVSAIRTAPAGGYLLSALLVDLTFKREECLLRAFRESGGREPLVGVCRARGFTPELFKGMAECLGVEPLKAAARDVLVSFGDAARDHLAAVFLNRATGPLVKGEVARLLARTHDPPVARLVEHLTGRDKEQDDAIVGLLSSLGPQVIGPLGDLYRRSRRVAAAEPERSRLVHRRKEIARAIARADREKGRELLDRLAREERDPDVRSHLQSLLAEGR